MKKHTQATTKKPKKTITHEQAAEMLDDAGDDKEGVVKPSKKPLPELRDVVDVLALAVIAAMNIPCDDGSALYHTLFDARLKLRGVLKAYEARVDAMQVQNAKDASVVGRELVTVDNRLRMIAEQAELLEWALRGHLGDGEEYEVGPFLIPLHGIGVYVKDARAKLALEAA